MPKNAEFALAELEQRWRRIFETLAAGGEVPPSLRLRTEGFMEALVALELATEGALAEALEDCYLGCFSESLPEDWRDLMPFPQVPGFGRRAPVFPSTSD
jgi:hypothetical protein